jgi:SAM-dependent methyltransferase
MIDIFNGKVAKLKLGKAYTALVDLGKGDVLTGRYDVVLSSMTLHHVKDMEALFAQFHRVTAPGGSLCIADLDLDDGKFHADNTGVFHFGFSRAALREVFTEAGFDYVGDRDAAEMVKTNVNGEMGRFSIFLMIGQKSV